MKSFEVIGLDLLGTLFAIDSIRGRLEKAGLAGHDLEIWLGRVLRDGFAAELACGYRTFHQVAHGTLRALMKERGLRASDAAAFEVLAGFSELLPYPDVEDSLAALSRAGARLVAMTNLTAESAEKLLNKAGVAGCFQRIVSGDVVQHWKPAREFYEFTLKTCRVEPSKFAYVSAHAWDLQGAAQAGLTTAWLHRKEAFPGMTPEPSLRANSLPDLVRSLAWKGPESRSRAA
ncbi:MAG: haloacid dehalogenase type II [Verrucomicrobiae bacterium]|nr:haloacid dehalogenase type II [Verrucomicrobiae bacterium]